MGRRKKALTLACLIKAMHGLEVRFELRNEMSVTGTIELADDNMNLELSNVAVEHFGVVRKYELLFLNGFKIRFVDIPDSVDVGHALEKMTAEHVRDKAKAAKAQAT
mmetsp:Transcript_34901/g.79581  ORF Transcript_34901/g.79581 Transcript_34901/m.79581 type:complete len:107 (-) Transcript_34901:170-490(-)